MKYKIIVNKISGNWKDVYSLYLYSKNIQHTKEANTIAYSLDYISWIKLGKYYYMKIPIECCLTIYKKKNKYTVTWDFIPYGVKTSIFVLLLGILITVIFAFTKAFLALLSIIITIMFLVSFFVIPLIIVRLYLRKITYELIVKGIYEKSEYEKTEYDQVKRAKLDMDKYK